MLRLLLSKAQGHKKFCKTSKPCHVGTQWIALAEHSQMSTHMPGFQSSYSFLHNYVLAKSATSSIRVMDGFPYKTWDFQGLLRIILENPRISVEVSATFGKDQFPSKTCIRLVMRCSMALHVALKINISLHYSHANRHKFSMVNND